MYQACRGVHVLANPRDVDRVDTEIKFLARGSPCLFIKQESQRAALRHSYWVAK